MLFLLLDDDNPLQLLALLPADLLAELVSSLSLERAFLLLLLLLRLDAGFDFVNLMGGLSSFSDSPPDDDNDDECIMTSLRRPPLL
jgi:hypothetical protein